MAFDYTQHAGAGTEHINKGVLGMPLLGIVQKGSPQFDETHKNHAQKRIDGCRPGDLVFAITNSVLPRPVEVIVTGTSTVYTEWRPKSAGGGYVGVRGLDVVRDPTYRAGGKPGTKEEHKEYIGENELIYTIYMAVQFKKSATEWEKAIISFTSTQLKKGRAWMKSILNLKIPGTEITAPIFAGLWSLGTAPEANKEGGWFGWDIKLSRVLDGNTDEALLVMGSEIHQTVQASLPSPKSQGAVGSLPAGASGGTVVDESDVF
jgi:hypothetical protein